MLIRSIGRCVHAECKNLAIRFFWATLILAGMTVLPDLAPAQSFFGLTGGTNLAVPSILASNNFQAQETGSSSEKTSYHFGLRGVIASSNLIKIETGVVYINSKETQNQLSGAALYSLSSVGIPLLARFCDYGSIIEPFVAAGLEPAVLIHKTTHATSGTTSFAAFGVSLGGDVSLGIALHASDALTFELTGLYRMLLIPTTFDGQLGDQARVSFGVLFKTNLFDGFWD